MKKKATKTARVAAALTKTPLTAKQISSRFDVPNVRAMIFDLKRKGLRVIPSVTLTSKGLTTRYRIWTGLNTRTASGKFALAAF
jgi:hypothetical protein